MVYSLEPFQSRKEIRKNKRKKIILIIFSIFLLLTAIILGYINYYEQKILEKEKSILTGYKCLSLCFERVNQNKRTLVPKCEDYCNEMIIKGKNISSLSPEGKKRVNIIINKGNPCIKKISNASLDYRVCLNSIILSYNKTIDLESYYVYPDIQDEKSFNEVSKSIKKD